MRISRRKALYTGRIVMRVDEVHCGTRHTENDRFKNKYRRWPAAACVAIVAFVGLGRLRSQPPNMVVVYSSEDQPCAEPILKDFERDTGIHVSAVYDKEAATIVMKRLIDEKDSPKADVYWANEPVHPDELRALGITQPYVSPAAAAFPPMFKDRDGHWTAFSARARVLVINSNASTKPDSIKAYADSRWRGRAILANPLLNTTAFNLTALFNLMGDDAGWKFLENVKNNGVRSSPGNADSAIAVASGQAVFSLVDIDDGLEAQRHNAALELKYPDQGKNGLGVFMVANAVAMIKGAAHPQTAKTL